MGRQHHDPAGGAQRAQARDEVAHRPLVEAGERLVQQHEPRLVQQRALEGQTLPHAAGENADPVGGAVRESRLRERRLDPVRRSGVAVQAGEEIQVLTGRQFRVDLEIVREIAETAPERRTQLARRALTIENPSARRRDQCGEHPEQRRLAGAVRAEKPDDLARPDREGYAREGALTAVVSGNAGDCDAFEVERVRGAGGRHCVAKPRRAGGCRTTRRCSNGSRAAPGPLPRSD